MSLGLQSTKRRIASVSSTKKITAAMSVVATAKLKTWKDKLQSSLLYAEEMNYLVKRLFLALNEEDIESFFSSYKSDSDSTIYVLITSSLGLCGGYNYNLYKEFMKSVKENDHVIVIGSKGEAFLKRNKISYEDTFVNAFSGFDYSVVRKLSNYLMSKYNNGECCNIKIAYTHYKNSITFEPIIKQIFPIVVDDIKNDVDTKELNMIIEPDPTTILKEIVPLYLKSTIFSCLIESMVSEQSSRRNAMDSATDNAEELVKNLMLEYNKARQAAITQEITEVVGGANASK